MELVLEIEFLTGVSFAALGPDSDAPDWPPQPDRIFSALVATWAARGQARREAEALRWLEALPIPQIRASEAEPRTSAAVFVPPNDPRSDRQKGAKGVLPSLRSRKERRFVAVRPYDATVRICWSIEPDDETLVLLNALARDTSYIGHSTSLTRCRFILTDKVVGGIAGQLPKRGIYKGRFGELCDAYADFERSNGQRGRPQPGVRVAPVMTTEPARHSIFADRWLVLEHVAGRVPDLRGCAIVAKAVRDSLLAGYERSGLGARIPEVVSGHQAGGVPSRVPHLAIVPMPFVGFPHSDGHVMGFALVPPRDTEILDDRDFRAALRILAPIDEEYGRRVLTVTSRVRTSPDQAFSVGLSPTMEAAKQSIDPASYVRSARTFATVTPIVLDRHLKEKGDDRRREIEAQVVAACRYIGLPEPDKVVVDKHSAVDGAPSAYPSGRSPVWLRWRLPRSLVNRQLTHAVIQFAKPVEGPVLLGAGRYVGLGLCRPLDPEQT